MRNVILKVLSSFGNKEIEEIEDFGIGTIGIKRDGSLSSAIALAALVFQDVYDKGGNPYFLHCMSVRNNVRKYINIFNDDDIDIEIAAMIHDVVEDTNEKSKWNITLEVLRQLGFSERVIKIIKNVSKLNGEDYGVFIKRILPDRDSVIVKLGDIEDNSNILRIKDTREKDLERTKKYHYYFFQLQKKLDEMNKEGIV